MSYMSPENLPGGYSQYQYLDFKTTVTIPATASTAFNLVASATVPNGQYWLPKIIRISLKSAGAYIGVHSADYAGPPTCQIFYGAPQVQGAFPTTGQPILNDNLGLYLDGTMRGDADQSGVCAGMFLTPGTSLTAIWRDALAPLDAHANPVPGATAVLEIIGLVSNVPLSASLPALPGTMGEAFKGKPANGVTGFATGVVAFHVPQPGPGNDVILANNLPPYIQVLALQWEWNASEPTSSNSYSGVFFLYQTSPVNELILTYESASPSPKWLDFKGLTASLPGNSGTSNLQLRYEQAPASGMVTGFWLTGSFLYASTDSMLNP